MQIFLVAYRPIDSCQLSVSASFLTFARQSQSCILYLAFVMSCPILERRRHVIVAAAVAATVAVVDDDVSGSRRDRMEELKEIREQGAR